MRIHDFIRHAKLTHGRGHRLKKPKRLLPALAIELSYATEIHLLQSRLKKVIDQIVVPKIESLVKQAGNVRLDFNENHDPKTGEFASAAVGSVGRIHLADVLTSQDSFNAAHRDNGRAKGSRTKGPVELWRLPDGRHLLLDGQHRFAEAVAHGDKSIEAKLLGNGYNDTYATPGVGEEFSFADETRQDSIRLDDWTDGLDRAIELARATFNGITPREDIQDLALKYAQETSKYQRAQLAQSLQTAIGVNVFFDNAKLLGRMKAHVKQNVDLITSIDEDLLDDIKGRLTTGIRSGTRVEELRDMIEERYDVTKSKASLIARDQTGKFYGELNRDRQTGLGINSYTWRGTLDQRERPMHVDLEGEVFQWGQPPITNSDDDRNEPGGDYQCRCTAEPVLDDLAL